MPSSERYAHIGIRFGISLIFINSLLSKITGFSTTSQFMAANGFFLPALFLVIAIIIEAAGIASLLSGYRLRQGSLLLLIYVFSTTFIFHTRLVDPLQLAMFLKNVSIIGALGILSIRGEARKGGEAYTRLERRAYVASRIAIALIFVVMGLTKIFDYDATKQMMIDIGLSSTDMFLPVAIVVELAGGIALLAGFREHYAALGLIVYLIPVTLIMHLELGDVVERIMFFKNIALMGALGLIALYGARPWINTGERQSTND